MSTTNASPQTERAGLSEFLDYQREALIAKLQGLSEEQPRMTPTVSSLSLLSLVKHSAIWERQWFQVIVAGRRFPGEWPEVPSAAEDPTFPLTEKDTVETVVADYQEQIAASQEILGSFDLGTPCKWPEMADQNLRWVALHMIEETARHAGHADIIRETIDGTRGGRTHPPEPSGTTLLPFRRTLDTATPGAPRLNNQVSMTTATPLRHRRRQLIRELAAGRGGKRRLARRYIGTDEA